jgi:hypothetical protein
MRISSQIKSIRGFSEVTGLTEHVRSILVDITGSIAPNMGPPATLQGTVPYNLQTFERILRTAPLVQNGVRLRAADDSMASRQLQSQLRSSPTKFST